MSRVFVPLVALALGVSAVAATPARAETPPTFADVVAGFSAKETCSCAFVVGQTDAYCSAFGQPPGIAVEVVIDRAARRVESRIAGVARVARMSTEGCRLDPIAR